MKKKFSMAPLTKKMLPVLLSAVFLLPLAAHAEIKAGSIELSPFVGYNFFDNQHNIKDRPVFGGRIGYNFTSHFGLEGTGEFSKTRVDDKSLTQTEQGQFTGADDVKIISYHLDLVYHFLPEEKFNPFIAAGYGASHYNPEINSKNMRFMDAGVGAKYWVAENIALRVDLRDKMTSMNSCTIFPPPPGWSLPSAANQQLRLTGRRTAITMALPIPATNVPTPLWTSPLTRMAAPSTPTKTESPITATNAPLPRPAQPWTRMAAPSIATRTASPITWINARTPRLVLLSTKMAARR
jgi:outer membrane beta-barrel protein